MQSRHDPFKKVIIEVTGWILCYNNNEKEKMKGISVSEMIFFRYG